MQLLSFFGWQCSLFVSSLHQFTRMCHLGSATVLFLCVPGLRLQSRRPLPSRTCSRHSCVLACRQSTSMLSRCAVHAISLLHEPYVQANRCICPACKVMHIKFKMVVTWVWVCLLLSYAWYYTTAETFLGSCLRYLQNCEGVMKPDTWGSVEDPFDAETDDEEAEEFNHM